jgi:predicted nucleic acid-binding protein
MKKTVYLDSTIPSYYYDERNSLKTFIKITKKWWREEKNNYEIFISQETLNELNEGNYPNKIKIIKFAAKIQLLPFDKRIINIAEIYLKNYLMPQVLKGDVIHLAYASYYKIDFLLTWNCNHLANANKKRHIRAVNTLLNLPTPEIITPLELFKEKNYDY